jgi:ribosome-binding factor A
MSRRQSGRSRGRGTGERRKARPPTNRHYPRTARLNALLQQIVADHLGRADDDRLGFLTVTGVEVDAELGRAVVYLSTLDVDDAADAELLGVLAEEYRKPIQADIARSARLRKTPEVVFALDPAVRTGARIDEILAGLDDLASSDDDDAAGDELDDELAGGDDAAGDVSDDELAGSDDDDAAGYELAGDDDEDDDVVGDEEPAWGGTDTDTDDDTDGDTDDDNEVWAPNTDREEEE